MSHTYRRFTKSSMVVISVHRVWVCRERNDVIRQLTVFQVRHTLVVRFHRYVSVVQEIYEIFLGDVQVFIREDYRKRSIITQYEFHVESSRRIIRVERQLALHNAYCLPSHTYTHMNGLRHLCPQTIQGLPSCSVTSWGGSCVNKLCWCMARLLL